MGCRSERPRRLSFYRRLSTAQKREYDRSDSLLSIPIAPTAVLGTATNGVVAALLVGGQGSVRAASQNLVDRICERTGRRGRRPESPPHVKVLRTRPRSAAGEFHGLYTRDPSGRSEIRVWMFTAARREVVRPRTFLRTLLHEVVHHFDMTLFDLPSSFHTIGFHARESSLLRTLEQSGGVVPGGRSGTKPPGASPPVERATVPRSPRRAREGTVGTGQLGLFPDL